MKRLIAVIGDKGGVGKSWTARALAETLLAAGKSPMLVDADGTVGHLVTYLGKRDGAGKPVMPQPTDGVRIYTLHGSERDRIEFGAILDEGRELVLVDLPAASIAVLRQVEEDYGFFALAHEAGYAVTLVTVVTPDPASMLSVSAAAILDPKADLVMLRNLAFGEQVDFVVWDGGEGRQPARGKAVLKQRGGHDLTMPRLNSGTVALIGAHRLTFAEAAAKTSPLIGARRSQVAKWLDAVTAEFGKAGTVLGL